MFVIGVSFELTPFGIRHLGGNPTVSHGCATVRHCWATVAGMTLISIEGGRHPPEER